MDNDKLVAFIEAVFQQRYLQSGLDGIFAALPVFASGLDLEARVTLYRNARRYLDGLAAELELVEQSVSTLLPAAEKHLHTLMETSNEVTASASDEVAASASDEAVASASDEAVASAMGEVMTSASSDVMTSVPRSNLPTTKIPGPLQPRNDPRYDIPVTNETLPRFLEQNITTNTADTSFNEQNVSFEENNLSWKTGALSQVPEASKDTVTDQNGSSRAAAHGHVAHEHTLTFDQFPYADPETSGETAAEKESESSTRAVRSSTPEESIFFRETDLLTMLQGRGTNLAFPQNPKATLLGMGLPTDDETEKENENEDDTLTFDTGRC